MAILKFKNVGMTAIAACVPSKVVSNYDLRYLMPEDNINRLVNSTGIRERRITEPGVTASDLCCKAAEELLADNNIDKNSIDLLIFSTLTPDFIVPSTSPMLQSKLGLPNTTACVDLQFACSGFIYALATAYAYVSAMGVNRALVLVGETMSKLANKHDRVNYPLYGDAGTACIVEKGDFPEAYFELTADGIGAEYVKVPYRGYRNELTVENLQDKEREDGNIRRDIDITMDGMETFNHAITIIPKQIRALLNEVGITSEDIDYLVSHQANKLMVDYIVKKVKIPSEKVPFCLQKYGNTSGPSIPLTIVSELYGKMEGEKRLFLSAIGAGWSCGTAYLKTKDLAVSEICEY